MSGDGDAGERVDRKRIDSTEPSVRDDVEPRQSTGPSDPPTTTSVGELQVRIASLELQLQQQKILHETDILKLKEAHEAEIDGLKAHANREFRELKKKGTWQLTLEKTPEAYWINDYEGIDESEEYANAMRNLQGAIKDSVVKLREDGRDESDDDDVLHIRLEFEGGGIHDHARSDDVMIPFWRELANALVHWSEFHARKGDRLELILDSVELAADVRDILRPAIAASKIRKLDLYRVTPLSQLSDFLGVIILANKNVRDLSLCDIRIESVDQIEPITRAIKARCGKLGHHFKSLGLSCCLLGGSLDILKEVSSCKIRRLILDDNEIDTESLAPILELIASNPPLEILTLGYNRLKVADASSIANALKTNTRLDRIHLDGNELTKAGKLALLKSTFDSDLNVCSTTNHICHIHGKTYLSDVNYSHSTRKNKASKYFTILTASSTDNFYNMRILRNIPTQLMPNLLSMTHECDWDCLSYLTDNYLELLGSKRQDKHDVWDYDLNEHNRELNCMFGLVRSWTAPSLFT